MASRRQGRPTGSGKRWTDDSDRSLYARIEYIKWRDGHKDARRAARTLVNEGYFHAKVNEGKAWTYDADPEKHRPVIRDLIKRSRPMGRTEDHRADLSFETLRKRYAGLRERYRTDQEFRRDCDFWIACYKEAAAGGDPIDAFLRVCETFEKH